MRRIVSALLAALFLSGCTTVPDPRPVAPPTVEEDLAERGQQLAAFWSRVSDRNWTSGIVPLSELTVVPPTASDEMAAAAAAGLFRTGRALSENRPRPGVATFSGGATLKVPLISAFQAFNELTENSAVPSAAAHCYPPNPDPRCLTVTGARLAYTTIRTSRGAASVPAWQFTVQGHTEPVMQVAVNPNAFPDVLPYDSVTLSQMLMRRTPPPHQPLLLHGTDRPMVVDGQRLGIMVYYGVGDTGVRGLAWESDDIVVVAGTSIPPPDGTSRPNIALVQAVWVQLSRPLGDRLVVEAGDGRPLIADTARDLNQACGRPCSA
jgi:hypothetical protein